MRRSSFETTGRLRNLCLALMLALAGAACSGAPATNGEQGSTTRVPPADEDEAEAETLSSDGKQWGGWRWKGDRDRCFYVHDNQCFEDRDAACEAAGCESEDCLVDRAAPAKVSCKQ